MRKMTIRPDEAMEGSGRDIITAPAVGSGVVLCLYDEITGMGGMCYILSPQSGESRTVMQHLLDKLIAEGVRKENLWAKLVGGATIFSLKDCPGENDFGKSNVEYVRNWLHEVNIPVFAEDTGNNFGRTVSLELEDGNVKITLANRHVYDI